MKIFATTFKLLALCFSTGQCFAQSNQGNDVDYKKYYARAGAELFLSHASNYQTVGAFLTEQHAIELRRELTYASSTPFEGRTIRLKSFWTGKVFYTSIGVHSYEDKISERSDGSEESKEERKNRTARSAGVHGALGSQWQSGYFTFGVEYISIFHALVYQVEGESDHAASEAAVSRSGEKYKLNWPLHTPQLFIGVAI